MYINACSTISHQNSFQNKNWINELTLLDENSELITPNYKEFIAPAAIRRMSKIIRMGLTCGKDCVTQSGIKNPDAIIVGTGLGCLVDTEKFLNNALTLKGLIPPTSFIQSTHNTIAGQISLELKNHKYNITHTQNSLSFEHALVDAILCLNESDNNILVGAVDEEIPLLKELAGQFGMDKIKAKLSSSASFFMLSNTKTNTSNAKLIDSHTIGLNNTKPATIISDFLDKNNTILEKLDMVLAVSYGTVSNTQIEQIFEPIPVKFIEENTGFHLTTSAFGMHLGADMLAQNTIKNVLIYNTLNNSNIGLTLLQSLEA